MGWGGSELALGKFDLGKLALRFPFFFVKLCVCVWESRCLGSWEFASLGVEGLCWVARSAGSWRRGSWGWLCVVIGVVMVCDCDWFG